MINYSKTEVLIVGAGPVGLSLACYLKKYGISFRLIDKRNRNFTFKKALAVNHATLNVFNGLDLGNELIEKAHKVDSLIMYWKKERLNKISLRHVQKKHPYFIHIYQPQTEDILINWLKKSDVDVERELELDTFQQNDEYVSACLKSPTGKTENIKCEYIVGCDGGSSVVRDTLGIELEQNTYAGYFVLADVKIMWDKRQRNIHYFVSEQGYLMIVPSPSGMHRIIVSFLGNYCPKKVNINFLQDVIAERGGNDIKIKSVEWFSHACFGYKIAKKGSKNRAFLAGDAYHQFSPVGGINMNFGIQDAHNLAWKLAYVLHNKARKELLNSYQEERNYVIEKTLENNHNRTLAITRLSNEVSVEKYLPRMSNRSFLKYELPRSFSGLDMNYQGFFNKEKKSLFVGKHISEIDLFSGCYDYKDTYNFHLFVGAHVDLNEYLNAKKFPIKMSFCINKNENYYLMRPDGYIVLEGHRKELEENLNNYFNFLI